VDVLWEDRPPPSARASLQILITRLRKALAGVPECMIERYGPLSLRRVLVPRQRDSGRSRRGGGAEPASGLASRYLIS